MTRTSFLSELHAIHDRYNWFVNKDGRIQATCGTDGRSYTFDPITAVAFSRTGEFFPEGRSAQAAASIGLSLDDCADFVSASSFDWNHSSRQGAIRREVLDAVGIPEETQAVSKRHLSSLQFVARNLWKRSAGRAGL